MLHSTTSISISSEDHTVPSFTPTEQRILRVLSDGMPHHRNELIAVLWDEMTTDVTVRQHIFRIRKKLSPIGQDIVCVMTGNNGFQYRQMRMLHSANDGQR